MAIFSNEGQAQIIASDGAKDSKDYSTARITGDDTVNLNICTSASSGIIKITDEEFDTIDSKGVNW
jgi:hypothetical protein